MIDLKKLELLALKPSGVVTMSTARVQEIHDEIKAARAQRKPCGTCFGLPPGVSL